MKRAAKCGVGAPKFTVKPNYGEHILRERECPVDFVPGALALDDPTEGSADARHDLEQGFIRRFELAREEFEDAGDLAPDPQRKGEGRGQAGSAGGLSTRKAAVPQITGPSRLAGLQDLSRQALANSYAAGVGCRGAERRQPTRDLRVPNARGYEGALGVI